MRERRFPPDTEEREASAAEHRSQSGFSCIGEWERKRKREQYLTESEIIVEAQIKRIRQQWRWNMTSGKRAGLGRRVKIVDCRMTAARKRLRPKGFERIEDVLFARLLL